MTAHIDRHEAIARIKKALRARTGRTWSVRGGRGTAWAWITITAPPARLDGYAMTDDDCRVLADALGVDVGPQGVSIPGQSDYRAEYVDRAEGRPPTRTGVAQWD